MMTSEEKRRDGYGYVYGDGATDGTRRSNDMMMMFPAVTLLHRGCFKLRTIAKLSRRSYASNKDEGRVFQGAGGD